MAGSKATSNSKCESIIVNLPERPKVKYGKIGVIPTLISADWISPFFKPNGYGQEFTSIAYRLNSSGDNCISPLKSCSLSEMTIDKVVEIPTEN